MRVIFASFAAAVLGLLSGCKPAADNLLVPDFRVCDSSMPRKDSIKVVSFNIRSGLSSSIEKVGDVLEHLDADVIALQEVDLDTRRSGRIDQSKVLAERLGYQRVFAASIKRDGGLYGVAMLSRLPFEDAQRLQLDASGAFEPRVAISAIVCNGSQEVRVVGVHADVFPWSSASNARQLAKDIKDLVGEGVIVAGDLNAQPTEDSPRELERIGLLDLLGAHDEGPTFLDGGNRRIDYIFTDRPLSTDAQAQRIEVKVSDHIPVLATLQLGRP